MWWRWTAQLIAHTAQRENRSLDFGFKNHTQRKLRRRKKNDRTRKMSHLAMIPRKSSGVQVTKPAGGRPPPGSRLLYSHSTKENGARGKSKSTPSLNAGIEVELLNHCFDDVERFMSRLQQAAEAQTILNQKMKAKKGSRKSQKKKEKQDYGLLAMKACPPTEAEFIDIFQKIKYSLSLLDRLKSSLAEPSAPKLLHHVFLPLRLLMNTTGGPLFGASVVSPAMTSGAVSLLQDHLTDQEKLLWTSLGPNWTLPSSHLGVSVPPYSPVFMDGWQLPAYDSSGQPLEDPIEQQHKHDAFRERSEEEARCMAIEPISTDKIEESGLPPDGERLYYCTYDFVARNSSELSVLQGETLNVIESSSRWWKCQNRFSQIGFLPSNILEPLSALSNTQKDNATTAPSSVSNKCYPYGPAGMRPTAIRPARHQSMLVSSTTTKIDGDKVQIVNDELNQRLANGRQSSSHTPVTLPPVTHRPVTLPPVTLPPVTHRPVTHRPVTAPVHDKSTLLNYKSPAAEVAAWLTSKGFSQQTVQSLGILTAAQLFSLNKDELRAVSPDEGARVHSQITVQKALLEDVRKKTELEVAMEKQKMKIDMV
ncbi:epidermal growth factor receptor kinase substrate 8-like protein 1a isoform X2 [Thalassophryne amazonica]|uniref:epidermal growth factor receptor kinase substrate 8-like protein 1a isoform X2 n=1 Tax=Thalassophryne amazonica TaxID=390379 RepID=UPI0014712847|nr:epidermal growth factor receptor kinase substrate 8-like protein 1a isoform X2 [Thalassophryne amazonica]